MATVRGLQERTSLHCLAKCTTKCLKGTPSQIGVGRVAAARRRGYDDAARVLKKAIKEKIIAAEDSESESE